MSCWFELCKLTLFNNIYITLSTFGGEKLFFHVRKYKGQWPTKEGVCLNEKEVNFLANCGAGGTFGNLSAKMGPLIEIEKDGKKIVLGEMASERLRARLKTFAAIMQVYASKNMDAIIAALYKFYDEKEDVLFFLKTYGYLFNFQIEKRSEWEAYLKDKQPSKKDDGTFDPYYCLIYLMLHRIEPENFMI